MAAENPGQERTPRGSADELIVGIDLGTTFSLIAYMDERGPQVVRDTNGDARLPSMIAFTPGADGAPRATIGWMARARAVENPRTTVYSVKRLIGKSAAELVEETPFLAYAVHAGPRDTVQIDIDGRRYSPEEISALILRELRQRAEQVLNRSIRKAVITVPAYFDDAQRQATRNAGAAAGLEVVRIVNEPTAAALAYGIGVRRAADATRSAPDRAGPGARTHVPLPLPHCTSSLAANESAAVSGPPAGGETVAVYDLGGGTFDVSILRIEEGVFQVLATAGDTHLGGDDFDRAIMQIVTGEVHDQFGLSVDAPAARQALRLLAESVKIRLSTAEQAAFELDLGEGRVFRRQLLRGEFEKAIDALVGRTLELCRGALRDARLQPRDLDRVILVGGSTRVPFVRQRVAEQFGREPYTALDPDEVVALGAAVQAGILAGRRNDMLLLDVTPLSLGIETMGGAMGKLILRNTTIPCRATEMFTTFVDGQTAIRLNVLQGERELARDCRSIGEFELREIPPMPAGIPKVEVEFLIDANGILNVSANEQRSGRKASIQIIPNRGLTEAEVRQMMRESVSHAAADVAAHRRIDLLNQVEFDTIKTEQVLARVGERLDPAERGRIAADIADLRRMAADPSVALDALHRKLDEFGKGTRRLAELGILQALTSDDD